MTKQIVLRAPPSMVDRRQPLLEKPDTRLRKKASFGELAGGTAAECAAVCCCCPCGLVNLLVLAVYKLPAGLCRKALRKKRRRRLMKKGLLPPRNKCGCNDRENELLQIHPINVTSPIAMVNVLEATGVPAENVNKEEEMELEKEMWDKFYGAGFWRSYSQRSEGSALELNK